MTNPTPHGQVPVALIDLIDTYAETRHRYGRIHNARTEAARNAVIEALSGVQALSAAPAGWKLVPVNPTPEMWKAAKSVPDPNPPYPPHYGLVWDAMLAASPTPTAEQASPKAAPGVGNSGFDHKTAADFLNGKTVSDEAVRKFVAASRWAHDERAALSATLLAMHGVLTSREAEIALLKKALMEAEAVPQQEAQEPVAWLNPWRADQVTTDYDAYGEHGIALYTAPQPAPAPLSDDVVKDVRKALDRAFIMGQNYWADADSESFTANKRSNVTRQKFNTLRDEVCAALAAQGGK